MGLTFHNTCAECECEDVSEEALDHVDRELERRRREATAADGWVADGHRLRVALKREGVGATRLDVIVECPARHDRTAPCSYGDPHYCCVTEDAIDQGAVDFLLYSDGFNGTLPLQGPVPIEWRQPDGDGVWWRPRREALA